MQSKSAPSSSRFTCDLLHKAPSSAPSQSQSEGSTLSAGSHSIQTSNNTLTTCCPVLELFVQLAVCLPSCRERPREFRDRGLFKLFLLCSWRAYSQGTWNSASWENTAGSKAGPQPASKGVRFLTHFLKQRPPSGILGSVISWGPAVRSSCMGISAGPMGKGESGSF